MGERQVDMRRGEWKDSMDWHIGGIGKEVWALRDRYHANAGGSYEAQGQLGRSAAAVGGSRRGEIGCGDSAICLLLLR